MPGLLLIHPNAKIQSDIQSLACKHYSPVEVVPNLTMGLQRFKEHRFELTLFDTAAFLPKDAPITRNTFKSVLQPFWKAWPNAWLVALAEQDQVREAVTAVKAGADDYLTIPITGAELEIVRNRLSQATRQEAELAYLRDQFWKDDALELVKTVCPAMHQLYENVKSVAPTPSTVLLQGETGVGKGVLARLIHRHSRRSEGPFIAIHCGAIPDNLIESELFGHERGAFTGAVKRKSGLFEMAHKGTLFLDEIGTITPKVQVKLLKALQESKFHRVGGESEIQVDVRVIAATNEDLLELCQQGSFRRDLYYRINVFPLRIPSLRDRIDDIPFFIDLFLEHLNRNHQRDIVAVAPDVIEALKTYDWPGNIRELENLIERAFILEKSNTLTLTGFPIEVTQAPEAMVLPSIDTSLTLADSRNRVIEEFERQYLSTLLTQCKGRIDESARYAGIGVRQLHKLLTRYGLDKRDFKH